MSISEDNVAIQYFYDDLYRLTQITYPDTNTATFGYDDRGNVTSAANQNITYSPMVYDLNNRLTSITDSNNKTVSYQYNSLNQRTQMVADGRTINYTYDNGNRLYQVLLSPNPVATITYDLAGRRQTLSYPNLVATTYTPNRAGFLTSLLTRYNQQTTINSFAYTPDGMGNRATMTDLAGQHAYTYDDTYQLTQATHPNMPTEQFSYDQVGNRLSSQGQAPGSGRSTEYVYDFENRLIEVNYTGMVAQYKYDPFGRRIEKNANGTITRYLYDGPNIATEYDGSWNLKAQYVQTLDIDDPLTVTQGANTYYYHKDGLGSVVNFTDASGNVAKSYAYKSYGDIYSETGSLVQPFTFTGREYDPESGLYFYRARYYDPRAGRFLTKDPIGFAGGDVNLYRYVQNNPVNAIDPLGLMDKWYGYADPDFRDYVHKLKQQQRFRGNYTKDDLDRINKMWTDEGCPRGKGGKSGRGGQTRGKGARGLKILVLSEYLQTILDAYDVQKRADESGIDPFTIMIYDRFGIDARQCKDDPCSCYTDFCL